jgi:hypothetical protein
MGLPKSKKQSMPFRLDYLLKNNLIDNNLEQLADIRREGIDNKIYKFMTDKLSEDQ